MFGDNKSDIDSSMTPHSKIHKIHVPLSFYRANETIVAGVISCNFIQGSLNPADMLSKNWNRDEFNFMLKPLFFGKKILRNYLRRKELRGSSKILMLFIFFCCPA